jgi:hypothetical protein
MPRILLALAAILLPQRKLGAAELYHLTDDPAEKKDLAAAEPKKLEELRKVLAEQNKLDP